MQSLQILASVILRAVQPSPTDHVSNRHRSSSGSGSSVDQFLIYLKQTDSFIFTGYNSLLHFLMLYYMNLLTNLMYLLKDIQVT